MNGATGLDTVPPRLYAVQPLGQTAGLNWKSLPEFEPHPEGWQAEKRGSAGPEARKGTIEEPDSVPVV